MRPSRTLIVETCGNGIPALEIGLSCPASSQVCASQRSGMGTLWKGCGSA